MPPLLQLILVLVVAGLILWAIAQFPLDATIQKLIKVVVIVVAVLYVVYFLFGVFSGQPMLPGTTHRLR
jgi:L-asparagine transporter-like permease